MTTEKLPGGITVTHGLDEAGEETGLTYAGPIAGGGTGTWLSWKQFNDVAGRVREDQSTFTTAVATTAATNDEAPVTVAATKDELSAFDHRYSYDAAGNLAKVDDVTGLPVDGNANAPWTTRSYTFTANGARASLDEQVRPDGTATGPARAGVQQKLTYDTADRLQGGYVYDLFGRQTTIPAKDAPNPSSGDISLGYFDNDLPASVKQGSTSTSFTLDVAKRRLIQTTTAADGTTAVTRHYTDGSDNPSWVDTKRPNGSVETTRFVSSISGDLGAMVNPDGTAALTLPNIHGDVTTTVPLAKDDSLATGIKGWSTHTEYGTPIDPTQTRTVGGPTGNGWLGAKERSTTDATAGLTLMGDRFYNAITGAFTSVDPEPGGNVTAYAYPTDPINSFDLDGHWKLWRSVKKFWGKHGGTIIKGAGIAAFGVCVLASGGACAVAGAAVAAVSIANNAVRWHNRQITGKQFAFSSALDVGSAMLPGLRAFRGARVVSKGSIKDVLRQFRPAKLRLGGGRRAASLSLRSKATNYFRTYGRAARQVGGKRYAARSVGQVVALARTLWSPW